MATSSSSSPDPQEVFDQRKEALLLALGARVRALRKERQLGQEPLADLASLHRTHIYSIEKGRANPSFETLLKVADALEVSLMELMDFEEVQS